MRSGTPSAAVAAVALAGIADAAFGELPNVVHPVARLGGLVGALERRRPVDEPRRELAWGGVIVGTTVSVAALTGWGVARGLRRLPPAARVPLTALALKQAFSLRGLVEAGAEVRDLLARTTAADQSSGPHGAGSATDAGQGEGTDGVPADRCDVTATGYAAADVEAARESLKALVSRSRDLTPPQIVSATVESLAENLTDSVTAPLLAYALAGLPGAYAYRAVNTMDAMIGYRGEYEHVGKIAARLDDVANFVPARLTGGLLCGLAATRRRGGAAWAALCAARNAADSPNKMWTIAPLAGLLGVRLEKPGHYQAGAPERPLTPEVISEAIAVVWRSGAAVLTLCAALAAGLRARGGK